MSKHTHETVLPAHSEQIYLNERMQSARWLGWDAGQTVPSQTQTQTRSLGMRLAEALGLTSVTTKSKPT